MATMKRSDKQSGYFEKVIGAYFVLSQQKQIYYVITSIYSLGRKSQHK